MIHQFKWLALEYVFLKPIDEMIRITRCWCCTAAKLKTKMREDSVGRMQADVHILQLKGRKSKGYTWDQGRQLTRPRTTMNSQPQ